MSKRRRQAQAMQEQGRAELDRTLDWQARGRARAVRTAWLVGGLALAFFVAALVEGHLGHLHPSWEPEQPSAPTAAAAPAATPAADPAGATDAAGDTRGTPSSRP